jgi:hypothetical protein
MIPLPSPGHRLVRATLYARITDFKCASEDADLDVELREEAHFEVPGPDLTLAGVEASAMAVYRAFGKTHLPRIPVPFGPDALDELRAVAQCPAPDPANHGWARYDSPSTGQQWFVLFTQGTEPESCEGRPAEFANITVSPTLIFAPAAAVPSADGRDDRVSEAVGGAQSRHLYFEYDGL